VSDRLDCPDCSGTGQQSIGRLVLVCRFCGGAGYVGDDNEPAEEPTEPPAPPPPVWADPGAEEFPGCRTCLGAGSIVTIGTAGVLENPCPACSPSSLA